jgi:hypothetical protein
MPITSEFLERAARHIEEKSAGKDYVFLGDTNHKIKTIFEFVFSEPVLTALHRIGVKHIMMESGALESQVFLDAVAMGKLTPLQFAQTLRGLNSTDGYLAPELLFSRDLCIGKGAQFAAQLGMHFHYVEGHEGAIKPNDLKRFVFSTKQKLSGWLRFVQSHSDYFDDPEKLLKDIFDQNRDRYARRNINLGQIPDHLENGTAQEIIFEFWQMDTKRNYNDVTHLFNYKASSTLNFLSAGVDQVLNERLQQDGLVLQRIDELRHGEKAAVFYGAAHLSNRHGGFTAPLSPNKYSTFLVMDRTYPETLIQDSLSAGCYKYDDNLILLKQERLTTLDEFCSASPQEGIRQNHRTTTYSSSAEP